MSVLLESGMKLADKFFDIILRFFPDKEKAREASVELAKLVITAEVGSQWLVGQWRAMAALTITFGLVWKWIVGTLDFYDNAVDLTMGILWVIAWGGYALNLESVKTALTILRPRKQEDGK